MASTASRFKINLVQVRLRYATPDSHKRIASICVAMLKKLTAVGLLCTGGAKEPGWESDTLQALAHRTRR